MSTPVTDASAKPARKLSLDERREIFASLVQTQDEVANVASSRQIIAERYSISEGQLKKIEEEGIDREWPPLS
jgi:hypothetical protein